MTERTPRIKRRVERRPKRGRIIVHVSEPGPVVIDQGTRADEIEAPAGSTIERPKVDTGKANTVGFA